MSCIVIIHKSLSSRYLVQDLASENLDERILVFLVYEILVLSLCAFDIHQVLD